MAATVVDCYGPRFLEQGADMIADLEDTDRSQFVADLGLPPIKANTTLNTKCQIYQNSIAEDDEKKQHVLGRVCSFQTRL